MQLPAFEKNDNWAQGCTILVIGADSLWVSMVIRLQELNAAVSLAATSGYPAVRASKEADVRYVPWHAIYDLVIKGVVLTDANVKCGTGRGELNPLFLSERLTVIDLLTYPEESAIAEEAQLRGCTYVSPAMIFASQLQSQFSYLTGKSLPLEDFRKGLVDS